MKKSPEKKVMENDNWREMTAFEVIFFLSSIFVFFAKIFLYTNLKVNIELILQSTNSVFVSNLINFYLVLV